MRGPIKMPDPKLLISLSDKTKKENWDKYISLQERFDPYYKIPKKSVHRLFLHTVACFSMIYKRNDI
jgi:hypothetical protein